MPTARGQALADEYGIKFFETVSVYVVGWPHWDKAYISLLFDFSSLMKLSFNGMKSILLASGQWGRGDDSLWYANILQTLLCRVQKQISMWSRCSFQ